MSNPADQTPQRPGNDPSHKRRTRAVAAIGSLLLLLVSTLIGAVASEAAYRFWIYRQSPQRFLPVSGVQERPDVWFMSKPRWQFSEAFGYEYGSETIQGGSTSKGVVRSCWDWPANELGNMGRIEGSYQEASLKVLVFGDSWTAQTHDNQAWPNFLQRRLEGMLGRSVNVVNFGRDGYSVLQMFDLAAAKVPEWKPDLAIFAFITDDLTRARSWRTAVTVNGRERMLTTTEPRAVPDPERSTDTAIWHSKATRDWCRQMVASPRQDDSILAEMEQTVLDARARNNQQVNVFTLGHSFLYDRIVRGFPFYTVMQRARPSQNPRHGMNDFSSDGRFMRDVEILKKSGTRLVLVHLAIFEEMAQGKEMIPGPNDVSLQDSLARIVGTPVEATMPNAPLPMANLAAIKNSPADSHPSLVGLDFYGQAVANILVRNGYVK